MKKGNFKKMMSAALSAAMCSVAVLGTVPVQTVFATETAGDVTTGSSSLTVDKAVVGHTYKVYQIFTGDVDSDGKTLSNIRYEKNFSETGTAVPAENESFMFI